MGQRESSQPLKRFVNDPREAVNDAIEGLLWTSPDLQVLDGFPEVKVVARSDWKKDRVAVIAGGGAGHEPADAGMVGEGMLTAAVCGEIFTSPPADAVLQALEAVTGPAGCLVITRNAVGNNLNFVAGVNEAVKKHGMKVRTLRVADDLATARRSSCKVDFKGARGMAGLQLVVKVAGAAAQAGLPLDAVYEEAAAMAKVVRTQGVGFSSCSIPGQSNKRAIPEDEMEVGLGIHGEPGQTRVKARSSAKDIIDTMISQLQNVVPDTVPLCAMLNNLGAVPHLEMGILAAQVMRSEIAHRVELFIGPAHLLTSLDTNGISLSLAPLDPLRAERLCAPTCCRFWAPAVVPRKPSLPARRARCGLSYPPTHNALLSVLLLRACRAIEEAEEPLNRLDAQIANGDCGRNLAHAARLAQAALADLPLNDPGPFCECVAKLLRGAEGALSALCSIVFFEAGKALSDCKEWGADVADAFVLAKQAVEAVADVSEGMRTFMDALGPALRAAPGGLSAMALAAQQGARSTAFMSEATGRAAFTSSTQRHGVPDVGAMALALVLTAMAAPQSGSLSWVQDESVHERFRFGKVIGKGTFGVVHEVTDKGGDTLAVKMSKRGQESGPESFAGLDFLEQRHMSNWLFTAKSHIVCVHEVLVSPSYVYIVMESLTGPELTETLQGRADLTEKRVAQLARQILLATKDIHSYGMVHRDLKIDNFRFVGPGCDELKLVDVVGTMCFQPDDPTAKRSLSGTLSYLSPEALFGNISQAVDMWAVGVIFYLLLSGSFPYEAESIPELHERMLRPPDMDADPWPDVSEAAKDTVMKLLSMEVAARPTVDDVLNCAWIQQQASLPDDGPVLESGFEGLPSSMEVSRVLTQKNAHKNEEALAVVKTLYLVRHGEALHNVREREARHLAEIEARALGYAEDSDIKSAVEKARKEALQDEAFLDAPLSPNGKAMALDAQLEINRLLATGFPEPTCILVSPLERTLQTAAILFPEHPSTHVVESLRERRTGLPCDERKPAIVNAQRRTFCHMSFDHLFTSDFREQMTRRAKSDKTLEASVEEKLQVRDRAAEVIEEIKLRVDEAMAVVTHKGFLRELERGPLGRPDATEFGNCEVRVYDITIGADDVVLCRRRYCRDDA